MSNPRTLVVIGSVIALVGLAAFVDGGVVCNADGVGSTVANLYRASVDPHPLLDGF